MSASIAERTDSISPKRRAILTAAGDLFVARGYGAVSMEAIARAANVSKATLYAHFASKDALFATIIGDACRETIAAEDLLEAVGDDIGVELRAIGGRLLRFLLTDRALAIHRLVIAESIRFPELGLAFYDNGPGVFRRAFADWLVRRDAAGRLDIPDPTVAADHFIGMVRTGLYLRATLALPPAADPAAIDATVAEATAAFLRAYGPIRSCMTGI